MIVVTERGIKNYCRYCPNVEIPLTETYCQECRDLENGNT